jgi:hypothetical protein
MKTFETLREKLDIQDILSFDIPILIDDLELAQEDVEDDTEIHRIVERLIEIQKRGTLTIEDCDFIIDIEENLQIDEASPAWQRKEGKNPSGGLNKKGVASPYIKHLSSGPKFGCWWPLAAVGSVGCYLGLWASTHGHPPKILRAPPGACGLG